MALRCVASGPKVYSRSPLLGKVVEAWRDFDKRSEE
jgi:hypothetical protein